MKQHALDEIKRKALPILKKADVRKAALFGSYARGENTEESDIDILVDLPRGKTLIDLIGLEQDLEEVLKKKVDVVTYNGIHPLLEGYILQYQYPIL
ncbi:MAG TPA: nucleotidyltransferase family protein [Xanthomonadales bacterium]|nr:nucleotidyltransferase family protein [Xanthomonadales bacterium]